MRVRRDIPLALRYVQQVAHLSFSGNDSELESKKNTSYGLPGNESILKRRDTENIGKNKESWWGMDSLVAHGINLNRIYGKFFTRWQRRKILSSPPPMNTPKLQVLTE